MPKVTITQVSPSLDGEYDASHMTEFSGLHWNLIKKVAGVRAGEFQEALEAGDYDVFVCVAVIALWQDGKFQTKQEAFKAAETLLAAPPSAITFTDDDEPAEVDDSPPVSAPDGRTASGSDGSPSSEDSRSTGDDPPAMSLVSTGSLR